jgi:hypothetical protein
VVVADGHTMHAADSDSCCGSFMSSGKSDSEALYCIVFRWRGKQQLQQLCWFEVVV